MNAYTLIRNRVLRNPIRFQDLAANLVSSRMGVTVERYLWRGILISALLGMFFAVLGYQITGLIIPGSVVPFLQAAGAVILFFVGSFLGYLAVLRFPGIRKKNRATRINLTLHNAAAYMYAMRRGGAQLMVIFRSLSENASVYGEVALEFRQIVRDADIFGYDVIHAIRHLMETTPSEKLRQFLEDMVSVIESGGDLGTFLSGRVRLYQEEAQFEQKQFLDFLSLVAETYVNLFVAGPLFLIIVMVVMGMIGTGAISQMTLVTYGLLPIGSLTFIIVIDLISIKTEKVERYTQVKWLHEYADVRVVQKTGEEGLFARLFVYDRIRNTREFLRHPLRWLINDYRHTLYFTLPVALLFIVVVLLISPQASGSETYISMIDTRMVIAGLIVLIPYSIFYELWSRRVLGIESLIPDFLERMAGINRVGLTIAQAISIMVHTNLGLLTYEVKRIKRDMDWGANFSDALIRFEQRLATPMIARTVTLITKASEMSGSINEVLTIAAADARMSEILRRDRLSEMFIYTAVVYLAFFVFLAVIVVISNQFLPVLAAVPSPGMPAGGTFAGFEGVSTSTFHRIMYHTCLVQALFSGLIAGQMGEASLRSGLKHAAVMIIAALLIFHFVV